MPGVASIPTPDESGPHLGARDARAAAKRSSDRPPSTSWLRVDEAAEILGVDRVTFRRAIERNARRDTDGHVFSEFDGVRARKLGRQWRVLLDPCWSLERAPA
jgi:hypothetical protein